MELERPEGHTTIELQFGPTIVATLQAGSASLPSPDFTKIFVTRSGFEGTPVQSEVSMAEVLNGLDVNDTRLRDAVAALTS